MKSPVEPTLNTDGHHQHRWPPPAVILPRQLEVGERNGDARPNVQQDGEDKEEVAIQSVLFPPPDCAKEVVELHREGTGGSLWKVGLVHTQPWSAWLHGGLFYS